MVWFTSIDTVLGPKDPQMNFHVWEIQYLVRGMDTYTHNHNMILQMFSRKQAQNGRGTQRNFVGHGL